MSSEVDQLRSALEQMRRDLLTAQRRADQAEATLALAATAIEPPPNASSYASLFDALLEGCQIISHEWRYLYLNDMAARHARRDKSELIGRTIQEAYPGIEATPLFALMERCMTERQAQDSTHEFIYPDGSRAWFELRVQPIPEGILALTHDVTERRQSEDSLRDSEERLRLLIEQVEDYAIYMLDPDGQVASWNQGAEKLKGYSAESILGQHFSIFFTPEDRDAGKPARLLEQARRDRRTEDNGWRLRSDGVRFWANVVITALYDQAQTLVGYSKITRDLTERRRTEQALREQREWLSMAMEASNLGTWRHDLGTGVVRLDGRAQQHYGFSSDTVTLSQLLARIHPDDAERIGGEMAQTTDPRGTGRLATEHRVIHDDQSVRWLAVQARAHFSGEGQARETVFTFGTSQEITARKQEEAQLHKLHRTLAVLSDINQAIVRVRDLPTLFQTACRIAVEKGDFAAAWIGVVEGDGLHITPAASVGVPAGILDAHKFVLSSPTSGAPLSPAAIPLAHGGHLVVDDFERNPRILPEWRAQLVAAGWRAGALFPLKVSGHLRGLMVCYTATPGFFDDEELILLDELAGDISFAMEFAEQEARRQELVRALEEYTKRLELLHQIDRGLLQGGSIEDLIDVTMLHLRRVIPCPRAGVALVDERTNEMVVFSVEMDGPSEIAKGTRVPMPPSEWLQTFRPDGLKVIDNLPALTNPPPAYQAIIREGMVSILTVLLVSEGRHVGFLNLISDQPDFFTDEYQQIALEVGSQLTIAVQQHRLSEAVRRHSEDLELQVAARTVELQAAKEQVEAILNNSLDVILFLDQDLRIAQANPAFRALLGYSLTAPHSLSLIEIVHPDDQPRFLDVAERLIKNPDGQYVEVRVCRAGGSILDAEIGVRSIPDDGYVCVIRDASSRKAYERQLLFNASLQETVADAVISTDLDYRIRTWNKAAERMYGWSADEVIGRLGFEVLRPQTAAPDGLEQVERELLENGYATAEVTHIRKDGAPLYVLSSVVLFRESSGQPLGIVSVNHDISERRKAEQALRKALETEIQASLLKSRFVSMASHEFRTPLAVILASAETLSAYRARMTADQIDGRLDNIRQQVGHMTGVVEDILQLGRIQSGRLKFTPAQADLNALCREILDEYAERAEPERLVDYDGPDAPVVMWVDVGLIRQAFGNLISNALKYSPPEKPVHVWLRHEPRQVTFRVSDQGIGIPAEDLPTLFEPFYRASNTGAISGTGLGLSITRAAVERHGGAIEVDSQAGVGTTFTITLPTQE